MRHRDARSPRSPSGDTRRHAKLVLWAAGAIAIVGLVAGGIASAHLTSSLSDYDAPGSAVVLAQHQIQRATGANPEEGYDRRRSHCRADQPRLRPFRPESAPVVSILRAPPRGQERPRLRQHRRPKHDLEQRDAHQRSWPRSGT